MNKFVKNVFLAIMGVTVAFILYYICFGAAQWQGSGTIDGNGATVETKGDWMGLLYYMSASVEVGLSRYYYNYCYIPELHKNDGIDLDLVRGDTTNYAVTTSGDVSTTIYNMYSELYGATTQTNSVLAAEHLSYSSLENSPATGDLDLVMPSTSDYYYSAGWY